MCINKSKPIKKSPPSKGDLGGLSLEGLSLEGPPPVWKVASPDRYGLLKEYAKENRNNMTEAESALWNLLSNKNLGAKFLRQYIIGDYIVDFICRDHQLIIEVDGGYHSEPRQMESDEQRDKILQEKGYRVLRLKNEEILFDLSKVVNKIKKYL